MPTWAGVHASDPYASHDYLASLTSGSRILHQLVTDHYGRKVVQCMAGGVDISCAMGADGFAVECYGRLRC